MHVCNPATFDFDDELLVWSFGSYFNYMIGSTCQNNGFYSYTLDNICATLTDPLNGDPLERYSIMAQQVYGTTGCISVDYDYFLDIISVEVPNA